MTSRLTVLMVLNVTGDPTSNATGVGYKHLTAPTNRSGHVAAFGETLEVGGGSSPTKGFGGSPCLYRKARAAKPYGSLLPMNDEKRGSIILAFITRRSSWPYIFFKKACQVRFSIRF